MKINIRVVPRASRVQVKPETGGLKVYLTRPAVDGQANSQLIEVLADFLKVKKRRLSIFQGQNSRNKIVSVEDDPAESCKK